MHTVKFDGASEIKKPTNVKDEDCSSAWAAPRQYVQVMEDGAEHLSTYWVMHVMPNKEDMEAIAEGRGFWVQLHCGERLIPSAYYTYDAEGKPNDQ